MSFSDQAGRSSGAALPHRESIRGKRRQREARPGVVWILPAVLFFGVFGLGPLLGVFYLSFTDWRGLGDPGLVGLDNWQALSEDARAWNGLRLSFILTAGCWATQTPLALLFGVWAAGKQRFRAVVTAVYFLPLLLSGAAIALLWGSLLNPNFGLAADIGALIRGVLEPFGLLPESGPIRSAADANFLGDGTLSMGVIVMVILWQWLPFHMLLYQAAARQIPRSFYEAAEIDGATRLQQFFMVTLPQLRHTIVASSVLIIVGSMTFFETVLLITGGGPGDSTRILPLHMYYEGFQANMMGYASAIAVVLVVLGFCLALITIWVSGYAKMGSQREGGS